VEAKSNISQEESVKKFLAISAALIGFAAVSSAAPIFCGNDLIAHGSGTGSAIVCPTIGNPGDHITSISLTIVSDYTGWISGNPTVTLNYTIAGPLTFGLVPAQLVTTVLSPAGIPNSSPVTITDSGNLGIGPISGITVTPVSSIAGGQVTGSSAVVTLSYTATPSVPEPASMALMGGGLLGLGFLVRRKK
jgi:hypothetical protein